MFKSFVIELVQRDGTVVRLENDITLGTGAHSLSMLETGVKHEEWDQEVSS